MTDPTIPDASYSALFAYQEDRTRVTPEETIRRIAEPMIARELRRARDDIIYSGMLAPSSRPSLVKYMTDRADALAPVETDAADGLPL